VISPDAGAIQLVDSVQPAPGRPTVGELATLTAEAAVALSAFGLSLVGRTVATFRSRVPC
jgi:hypothetical protein